MPAQPKLYSSLLTELGQLRVQALTKQRFDLEEHFSKNILEPKPSFFAPRSWKQLRTALLESPSLRKAYMSENDTMLRQKYPIPIRDEFSARIAEIEAEIENLPNVGLELSELLPGQELECGKNKRLLFPVNLTVDGTLNSLRFSTKQSPATASEHGGGATDFHSGKLQQLGWSTIVMATSAKAPSEISTNESAVVGYRDEIFDHTSTRVSLRISQPIFEEVVRCLKAFNDSTNEDGCRALLSADVSKNVHVSSQNLRLGTGKNFKSVVSGPLPVKLFHLHLVDSNDAPIQSVALAEK